MNVRKYHYGRTNVSRERYPGAIAADMQVIEFGDGNIEMMPIGLAKADISTGRGDDV